MSLPMDPHHLVALMHGSMNFCQHRVPHHRNIRLQRPVVNIDNRHINYDKYHLSDALASICVSEAQNQVVALAIQLQPQQRKIRLIIAQNSGMNESVAIYLTKIWENLRVLAKEYASQWVANRNRQKSFNLKPDSKFIPPREIGFSIITNMFHQIYQYTTHKNQRRVRKWMQSFLAFVEQLKQVRNCEFKKLENELVHAILGLNHGYHLLAQPFLTNEELCTALRVMDAAVCRTEQVIDSGFSCESLVQELGIQDPHTSVPLQLRHGLKKLISQHKYFTALIAFANSRRLRLAFECQFSIITVPQQCALSIKLPSSAPQWKILIDNIRKRNYKRDEAWAGRDARDLALGFQKDSSALFVHPECALIEYLANERDASMAVENAGVSRVGESFGMARERKGSKQRGGIVRGYKLKVEGDERSGGHDSSGGGSAGGDWKYVPAFSYIGTSKPSCTPCQIWIKGYNSLGGPRFHTRGSDGKWNWPWKMSQFKSQQLDSYMGQEICSEYIKFQQSLGRLRSKFYSSSAYAYEQIV